VLEHLRRGNEPGGAAILSRFRTSLFQIGNPGEAIPNARGTFKSLAIRGFRKAELKIR